VWQKKPKPRAEAEAHLAADRQAGEELMASFAPRVPILNTRTSPAPEPMESPLMVAAPPSRVDTGMPGSFNGRKRVNLSADEVWAAKASGISLAEYASNKLRKPLQGGSERQHAPQESNRGLCPLKSRKEARATDPLAFLGRVLINRSHHQGTEREEFILGYGGAVRDRDSHRLRHHPHQ
jgi:hypothetical protein